MLQPSSTLRLLQPATQKAPVQVNESRREEGRVNDNQEQEEEEETERQKMWQIYSTAAERRAFKAAAGISGSAVLIRSSVGSQELPEETTPYLLGPPL